MIVDGGTLSNFPVWLFDVDDAEPAADAADVRLHAHGRQGRRRRAEQRGLAHAVGDPFGFDIFHTSQEAWDERFVSHSTRVRTVAVDAGNDRHDAVQPHAGRLQDMLINNGKAATAKFLSTFTLEGYENTYGRKFGDAPPGNGKPAAKELAGKS